MKKLYALLSIYVVAFPLSANENPAIAVGAYRFSEGLATVVIDGKWGYVNTRGVLAIPAIHAFGTGFREGYAHVNDGAESFYIDHAGARQTDVPVAGRFSADQSSAVVRFSTTGLDGNTRWGFKDKKGERAFPDDVAFASDFSDGLAAVYPGKGPSIGVTAVSTGAYGYVNRQAGYPVAVVRMDNRFGLVDQQGNVVVEPQYQQIGQISEGLASVAVGEWQDLKWGYLNLRGEMVIQAAYDRVDPFNEGFAAVWIGERQGYIDRRGNYVWQPTE